MNIEEIDKNFAKKEFAFKKSNIYTIPCYPFKLHGMMFTEEKGFHRIPFDVAKSVSEGVDSLNHDTAGGRITFRTNSRKIKIYVKYFTCGPMRHMPMTGTAGFSLTKVDGDRFVFQGTLQPQTDVLEADQTFRVTPRKKFYDYVLYFPLYNDVKELKVEIDKDAEVVEDNVYRKDIKPVLYYGSSITQGGCASRPDNAYQAYVSEKFNVDFVNLGFSGNCRAEDTMIDYLCGLKTDLFVYDYDHNAPTIEWLNDTHEKLYKAFRKTHPKTPIIFMSRTDCYSPVKAEHKIGKAYRAIVKKTYDNAVAAGDKNVYFIDGEKIFPKNVRDHCSVDTTHPTDLGFYFMANSIIKTIKDNKLL